MNQKENGREMQIENAKRIPKTQTTFYKTIESVAFALFAVLIIPLLVTFALNLYADGLKTHFASAMADVSKAWSFITQGVCIFIATKYTVNKAFLSSLFIVVGLFFVELIICLLTLISIY